MSNSNIAETAIIKKSVEVGNNCNIGHYSIIGKTSNYYSEGDTTSVELGDNVSIGAFSVVNDGVTIHNDVWIGEAARIDSAAKIGAESVVVYQTTVGGGVEIGENAVVSGGIGEKSTIGDNSQVLGTLGHRHLDPSSDWDEGDRASGPTVKPNAFVGLGAKIVGDITIGNKSYVGANAVITRDVPPKSIAVGYNNICYYEEWSGELAESSFFED